MKRWQWHPAIGGARTLPLAARGPSPPALQLVSDPQLVTLDLLDVQGRIRRRQPFQRLYDAQLLDCENN